MTILRCVGNQPEMGTQLIRLHDDQADMMERGRQSLRQCRRLLFQAAPGFGKTVLASFIAQQTASRGKLVYFICHRAELLMQTSLTFQKFGVAHSFIAAGLPTNLQTTVQICSIDTLKNRLHQLPEPAVVLWDEAHHIAADGWAKVMAHWPKAIHIGLSGTPWRLSGQGLGEFFDDMVQGPPPSQLIASGRLAPQEAYAPFTPDMKGVSKRAGEYVAKEARKRLDTPKRTGNIIESWLTIPGAKGSKTIGYAIDVEDSKYLCDQFNAAGIRSAHLDGTTDKADRKRTMLEFARGEYDVLWNSKLFGEGLDLAAITQTDANIHTVIDAAPTASLSWHLQKIMRNMRPAPGKVAILIDSAGNTRQHGFPDDDHEWSLEGREKAGRAANDNGPPPPITCDVCFRQIKQPVPDRCPGCGKPLRKEAERIEFAEGELLKVSEEDKRRQRQDRAREQAEAKTLDQLVALGQLRGYSSPVGWAHKVFAGRRKR